MNKTVIASIILAVLVTSTLVISEIYLGPLLSVRFIINQQPAIVYGAYLNLGNLTPGLYYTYSTTAYIEVLTPGVYNITINEMLFEAFSSYNVTLSLQNSTATSTLTFSNGYPFSQSVYLNKGNYSVYMTLNFVVSSNPSLLDYSGPVIYVYYK
ncbi:MAG: hypothetical protein MPF33_07930 [Candidatus Aramenus sp.]|jgi:hypothetical protein|nr:hypothetical protein [Candidatus Aramenus sp.]